MPKEHAGNITKAEQSVGERRSGRLFRISEIARSACHHDLARKEFYRRRIGRQFGFYQHGVHVVPQRAKCKLD